MTRSDSAMTLWDHYERAAEAEPERTAVIDQQGVQLTHDRLRTLAASVGTGLARSGLEPGAHIGVFLPNRASWPILALAAAHSGIGILGLNTRFREAELNHLLELAGVDVVAATDRFLGLDTAALLETLDRPIRPLMIPAAADPKAVPNSGEATGEPGTDGAGVGVGPAPNWAELCVTEAEAPAGSQDCPLIGFTTSGTTGFPKVAMHSQAQTTSHLLAVIDAFSLGRSTVSLAPLPLCGAFGYTVAMATLLAGGTVVTHETWDPEAAARAIDHHRVDYFSASDDMILATLKAEAFVEETTWSSGGFADFTNAGTEAVAEAARVTGGKTRLAGLYGSSEGFALMSTFDRNDDVADRSRNGGHLVSDRMEVTCCDPETGRPLPAGEPGELWFRGPNLIDRYLNNPEATTKAFTEDGWYRSGDLGHLIEPDRDGRAGFVFLSRLGDSLRLRGFLCDPAEIEHHLEQHAAVALAQVVGVDRPGIGEVAVGFVKLDSVAATTADVDDVTAALHRHCETGLANYKRPEHIVIVDEFPVTDGPNGVKIRKVELRERASGLFG